MARTTAFERFSDEYDDWFERHKNLYELELQAVRRFVDADAFGVEVGVGSGKFAAPLGIEIGVEPSLRMAAKAKATGIKVCRAVGERLPFRDASFDFALMVTTICFLDDPLKALQEIFRILEPSGAVVVGFVDKESAIGRRYQEKKNRSKFYREATFYSEEDVTRYLAESGFERLDAVRLVFDSEGKAREPSQGERGDFVVLKAHKPAGE